MFCPECGTEYRPGFIRCSDCDAKLVDHLSSEAIDSKQTDDSDYVVVATVQGPLEEGQICSFLESNGIPAQVRGEGIRKVYGLSIDGLGAAEILVPPDQARTAVDLLEKADRGDLEISVPDGDTSPPSESE